MAFPYDRVPDFNEISARLTQASGWSLVPCDGLVHEPDLFHDLFGHVPLLADPDFAAYLEAYGAAGQRAKAHSKKALRQLTRLYWWTVEFGLIQSPSDPQPLIYGAGIVSSQAESRIAAPLPGEGTAPATKPFDLEHAIRTKFIYTDFQPSYFVINDFADLAHALDQDMNAVYDRIEDLPVLSP